MHVKHKSRFSFYQHDLRETVNQIGKTETRANTKSENPLVFLPETENHMLIEGKPENRRRHQNRKTAVSCCENRKTDLKNVQNRETENPKVPLIKARVKDYSNLFET